MLKLHGEPALRRLRQSRLEECDKCLPGRGSIPCGVDHESSLQCPRRRPHFVHRCLRESPCYRSCKSPFLNNLGLFASNKFVRELSLGRGHRATRPHYRVQRPPPLSLPLCVHPYTHPAVSPGSSTLNANLELRGQCVWRGPCVVSLPSQGEFPRGSPYGNSPTGSGAAY